MAVVLDTTNSAVVEVMLLLFIWKSNKWLGITCMFQSSISSPPPPPLPTPPPSSWWHLYQGPPGVSLIFQLLPTNLNPARAWRISNSIPLLISNFSKYLFFSSKTCSKHPPLHYNQHLPQSHHSCISKWSSEWPPPQHCSNRFNSSVVFILHLQYYNHVSSLK